jgi:hypothetical protein
VKEEDETIRFPTNLDHTAIVLRLIQFRKNARTNGLPAIAEKFMEVESMSAATIASNVVSAITWLQDKVEYRALTRRLEMVAMNLKNLR